MMTLEEIHERDDFITQTRIRHALRGHIQTRYLKKEFVFAGGTWDGEVVDPLWRRKDRGKNLVLGESDYEFSYFDFLRMKALGGYSSIWSTHIASGRAPAGVMSLPLGLPYDSDYPFPFDVIGNISTLRDAYQSTKTPKPSEVVVLGAFAENTHPERSRVREVIENSPIGRWEVFEDTTKDSHRAYLSAMRESGLVACPRGVGIDTYRFWEAIYMGAVPILQKPPRPLMNAMAGLPYIVLQEWSELTDVRRVLNEYNIIRARNFDFRSVSLAHLLDRVQSAS